MAVLGMLLLLTAPLSAEPKALYTDLFARLRGAETDLGLLERLAETTKPPTTRDWQRTTEALARLESDWAESQSSLDKIKPPKYKELWDKTQQMLTLQRELAGRCALVFQSRYIKGDPSLKDPNSPETVKLARKQIPELRASYDKVRAELAGRL